MNESNVEKEYKPKSQVIWQQRFRKFGHQCTATDLIDPVKYGFKESNVKPSRWSYYITKLIIVNDDNPIAVDFFRSQFALDGEKIRHIRNYLYIIHLFSKFTTYRENFMILIYLMNTIYNPIYMSILIRRVREDVFYISFPIVMDFFCFIDIIMNFATGFHDLEKNCICLDWKMISSRYLKSWFLIDFMCWLPIEHIAIGISGEFLYDDMLLILKLRRFFILIRYIKNLGRRWSLSLITTRVIVVILTAVIFLLWVNALQILVANFEEKSYDPNNPQNVSWVTRFGIWDTDPTTHFFFGLYRAVLLATFQGMNEDSPILLPDHALAAIVWVSSWIITVYFVSVSMFTMNAGEYSTARYYSLINQLNIYMDRKELPQELRKKLLHYYQIRYNDSLVTETEILESITGGLLKEITMHSCRRLINNVPFLRYLSDDMLIEVVSSLRYKIFLPDEVIIQIGELAREIIFIVKGTVALYSNDGREVFHLHDGDYFGVMSLIGGPRLLNEAVIAVSPCELLCLPEKQFTKAAARHPEMLAEIVRQAMHRFDHIDNAGN